MLRRLLTSVALFLLLAGRVEAEPPLLLYPVRVVNLRWFWLGITIPFAILFILCVISSHMPWKRVRRRRPMPAVIRPVAPVKATAHRSGWRHARALGKFQGGVERPRWGRYLRGGGF